MKRPKWMASVLALSLSCCALYGQTYYLQSMGGYGNSGPLPFNPDPSAPLTEVRPGVYVVNDTGTTTMASGSMMTADSSDPLDPSGGGSTNTPPPAPPAPNIRNYAKYGAQVFSLLDTNALANEGDTGDSNLAYACGAINGPTNDLPWLTVQRYGANAVIIRADNFDYSQTNADFALLICDKVNTPIWKTVDFSHASDAQDGWLVQGTVFNFAVTPTMFMLVTNLNTTYDAFFTAIPYMGAQVAITGTNQPYDTVSNAITLTTQIRDLTGSTNEQFSVNVDGIRAYYTLASSNITLDTTYNANDIHQVYLSAFGIPTVHATPVATTNSSTAPADQHVLYSQSTYIPLTFQNDNWLEAQAEVADPSIGTNYVLFGISKPQNVAAIIRDPSNGHVVSAWTNYISTPGIVAVPFDFTEGDGVTPYSNDTYQVQFIAFDPGGNTVNNTIDRHGVRKAGGVIITYEQEDPTVSVGPTYNTAATTYIDNTIVGMYETLYASDFASFEQYLVSDIGPGRDNPPGIMPFVLNPTVVPQWATAVLFSCTNTYYSDFGYYMGHGNTSWLAGGATWVTNSLDTETIENYCAYPNAQPNWRFRKVAIWCCFSDAPGFEDIVAAAPNFAEAFGIRKSAFQNVNPVTKNVGLFFSSGLPADLGYSQLVSHTSVELASDFDQFWVDGPAAFPGGCDPTYAFGWAFNLMINFEPHVRLAVPTYEGFVYLPYTGNFDSQLITNNTTGIHSH